LSEPLALAINTSCLGNFPNNSGGCAKLTEPRQQRTCVSVVSPDAMGHACGLGRSRVVSRFSHCQQSHWPNGHAVAFVGESCQQVFDRDLLHLAYGSSMGGGVEATLLARAKEVIE
jgi:hypothetical protein